MTILDKIETRLCGEGSFYIMNRTGTKSVSFRRKPYLLENREMVSSWVHIHSNPHVFWYAYCSALFVPEKHFLFKFEVYFY